MPRTRKLTEKIAEKVIGWFGPNARDLPWRRTKDPYAIWVSEVMLQQTQVKTVIPYWERWMKVFPNAEALALAPEEQVLKLWEGLGYYSRARNLQRAAQVIVAQFDGHFPREFGQVLELPGIGRYTAGAICSIAYGQATPILDGNVVRVLSRLFTVRGSIKDRATQEELWQLSASILEGARDCSALNQGLMELGATVCTPRAPRCRDCPLRTSCRALQEGEVEKYPVRGERLEMRDRQFLAFIIRCPRGVLVRKREANVVNGGLWEFPNVELARAEDIDQLLQAIGIRLQLVKTIKHTITRNRITLHAFAGTANAGHRALAQNWRAEWRSVPELEGLPFSSAHAKLRSHVLGMPGACKA